MEFVVLVLFSAIILKSLFTWCVDKFSINDIFYLKYRGYVFKNLVENNTYGNNLIESFIPKRFLFIYIWFTKIDIKIQASILWN